jgi:hypothetical protein
MRSHKKEGSEKKMQTASQLAIGQVSNVILGTTLALLMDKLLLTVIPDLAPHEVEKTILRAVISTAVLFYANDEFNLNLDPIAISAIVAVTTTPVTTVLNKAL